MAPFSSTLRQQGWLLGPELCQGEIVSSQFPDTKENHTLSQLDLVHTDISKEAKQTTELCKWYELQVHQSSKIHYGKNLFLLKVLIK